MKQKILIESYDLLKPGDLIELHYRTIGLTWIQAMQIAAIENKINKDPRFQWVNYEITDNNKIVFQIRVVESEQEPKLQKAGVVGVAIIILLIGGVIWLSLEGIYKIVDVAEDIIETPAGKIGIAGIGSLGIAAAIAVIFALIKGNK